MSNETAWKILYFLNRPLLIENGERDALRDEGHLLNETNFLNDTTLLYSL